MARRGYPMPTGRIELLNWMNDFIESDYAKVEQACDGIAYAQIIDCAVGMKMPLHKLNFAARNEDDFARNLSILQTEFKKLSIEHPVAVDKLCKGRFQDNNEFLQWCFAFLHNCQDPPFDYPAASRRQEALLKQVRCKGRGALPPPSVKTELAYGIDLDASPYPAPAAPGSAQKPQRSVTTHGAMGYYDEWRPPQDAPPQQQQQQQQPPVQGRMSAGRAPHPRSYNPDTYGRGEGTLHGHASRGGHAREPAPAPPRADVPAGGGGGGVREDIDILELCGTLAAELRTGRVEQNKRRANLEALIKQRNSMWQQLRTIEELLKNFHVLNGDTMNYISDVLFERDGRLASALD